MGRYNGGREPVKETCPAINYQIIEINDAIRAVDACDAESPRSIENTISVVRSCLIELRKFLNVEMREANSALRDWGRKEEERVDALENELYDAKKDIAKLEASLKDAEYDRDNAQAEADAANEQLSKLRQEQGFLQDYLRTA